MNARPENGNRRGRNLGALSEFLTRLWTRTGRWRIREILLSILMAVLAQVVRLPLHPPTLIPYITYVPFIGLAAFAGPLAGLLTTGMCVAESFYFAVEPLNSLQVGDLQHLPGAMVLGSSGIVLTLMFERLRRTGRSIAAANQELTAIQKHVPVSLLLVDHRLQVSPPNQTVSQITGHDREEIRQQRVGPILGCLHSLDDPRGCGHGPFCGLCPIRAAALETVRSGRAHESFEAWVPTAGDPPRDRCFLISTAPLESVGARRVLVCAQDVTQHRLAGIELRRQARLLNLSHDAIITLDAGRRIVTWNAGAEEMYGWTEPEARGLVIHELLQTASDVPAEEIRETLLREERWEGELIHTARDGHAIVAESRQVLVRDAAGNPSGILQINRDVTDRKQSERALRESEEQYRKLFESLHEGFVLAEVLCDTAGEPTDFRYLETNPAMAHMLGRDRGEVLGRTYREVFPNASWSYWVDVFGRVALSGEPVHVSGFGSGTGRYYEGFAYSPQAGQFAAVLTDVSGRKVAERALLESEEQFRTLANAIPQLCWMADGSGAIFWYNQRWYDYTGLTQSKVQKRGWRPVLDRAELREVIERWKSCLKTGEPLDMVFRLRGADGAFRPFLTRVMPVRDREGKVARWFGTSTDITEQRRTEAALRESEERFRALVTASSDVVYRMSPDWSRMRQLSGRQFVSDPDSPGGNWLARHIHPDDRARVLALVHEAIRSRSIFEAEYRSLRGDGSVGWTFSRAVPLVDANTTIIEWFGAASDITQSKQAEQALRESEQRFRALVEQASDAFFLHDEEGWFADVNQRACETLGYTRDELLRLNVLDVEQDSDRAAVQADWTGVRSGEAHTIYGRQRRKDGTVFPVEIRLSVCTIGGKRLYLGLARDITERQRTEKALRDSEERLRLALEAGGLGTWDYDIDAGRIEWDERCRSMLGSSVGPRIEDVLQVIHPEHGESFTHAIDQAVKGHDGGSYHQEFRVVWPDGSIRWLDSYGQVHSNAGGTHPRHLVAVNADITARKRFEEALGVTVQQLESALAEKTILLKEVHHRVKNNLAVISSLLGMSANTNDDPSARLALEESQQRVHSIALIHEHLYGNEHLDRIEFAEYLRALVQELHGTLIADRERVSIEILTDPLEIGVHKAVPCSLILNELVSNAFKYAFPNGRRGRVTVVCREPVPGTVNLVISDDGVGLPEDLDWQRSGSLGLQIVRVLARQLGASLTVSRQQGTRVELTFGYERAETPGVNRR
jgi:PAS domain S-box-containing protein